MCVRMLNQLSGAGIASVNDGDADDDDAIYVEQIEKSRDFFFFLI